MKSIRDTLIRFALGTVLLPIPGLCQDPVKVAPKNVKVVFENDRVRVLEVHMKPGEKIPMHSHPPHLTLTMTNFKGRYVSPAGEPKLGEGRSNVWSWTEAITHSSENVGTTEIQAFAIELKERPKKAVRSAEKVESGKK